MRKIIFAIAASTILTATSASAAGFAGPRAEVRGGWDRTTIDLSSDGESVDGHKDGFDLGGEVGYDMPIGSAVIAGAYAGVEFATTKECGELFGGDELCAKLGRNFTLGARIGAKVSPKVMVYAKAGYSNGRLKASYDDGVSTVHDHVNRDGFHAGVGVEMMVGSHGYVRAEYVRTNYNDYRYDDGDYSFTLDGHRDQVLLGTGLRF